jgi:hypothetical protein
MIIAGRGLVDVLLSGEGGQSIIITGWDAQCIMEWWSVRAELFSMLEWSGLSTGSTNWRGGGLA